MMAQFATHNDGWSGYHQAHGENKAANRATSDLINILDAVNVPIVVVRSDFTIAGFNKMAADTLGLSSLDIGRVPSHVPVLAGLSRLDDQCNQAIARGVETSANFRHGDKWFAVRVAPCTRGDGQVTGTVLTFNNVTAFRASTNQAIYEREYAKAILNTVGHPLVVLSADHQILSGNRSFYETFQVSRDETQGLPLYQLGNGIFELSPLRTQLEEMLIGSDTFEPLEVGYASQGNVHKTLMIDARPLSVSGLSDRRVLVTFQDITARKSAEAIERKRAREKLRHTEAFLAEAQYLSRTGSFSWRAETDEITWSDELYRIFEFDQGVPITLELIGNRVHPEDEPLLEQMIGRARVAGSDLEYEYRLLMPNGSLKYLHLIAHGTCDRDGRFEYIGAVQDVTQRRLSEEALAKARSELSHVSRVASLGALTASIAHEVNQPLSGIITNASTCLRVLAADPPNIEVAGETARRMIRDGNRAADVIARLRALFIKRTASIEPVDLNEAAREVIALSWSDLQRSLVVLRTELADGLPLVGGDRVQLQQVIMNLLRNAADAMSEIHDRPRRLVIRTGSDNDGQVRLSVEDTGIGFGPDGAERLFEAFYTTKSDGMGIGLSVSRSIIDHHDGCLWAVSNDGPGATFSFSIPEYVREANHDNTAVTPARGM
ncbi:PAS domain-containing sensor histidine kinase [Mesorhizobium sp.]|uniref:PAS domain-containing sensor histidine kinase n=1 Tax=Mesorhizobium sp. TaxID=1871066 RepID=UPI0012270443|nr:PAS domain-containing sensor histidine kinase [Mesorhizobium sp.]TIL30455.1 MAG: PAS domain-containing protein [Mesorhizobium sp.]